MITRSKRFWNVLSGIARLEIAVGVTITIVVLIVLAVEGR
jgi:hypothetical protein